MIWLDLFILYGRLWDIGRGVGWISVRLIVEESGRFGADIRRKRDSHDDE
jgi:hypothetical protein